MFKIIKEKISAFIALLKTNAENDIKEAEKAIIKETEAVFHTIVDKLEAAENRLAAIEAKLEAVAAAPAIASDVPNTPVAETPAPLPEGPASQSDPLPENK